MQDSFGMSHAIDSSDLNLIGLWFREKAAVFMTADTRMHPYHLYIYPSGPNQETEREMIRLAHSGKLPMQLQTKNDWLDFAGGILAMTDVME